MADIFQVEGWILDYACSQRMVKVLSYLSRHIPNEFTDFNVPPIRILAATAWNIVKTENVAFFDKVIGNLVHIYENVPSVSNFRLFTKMIIGLKIKALLDHISKNYEYIGALAMLNKYFPKSGIKVNCRPENKKEIEKLNKQMQKFRMFIMKLLMNDAEREKYVKNDLDAEYGEVFMTSLKQLVQDYFDKMETCLPETAIDQFLLKDPDSSIAVEATSSPSSAVDRLIALLESGPPSEDDLLEFLQGLMLSQNNNTSGSHSSEDDCKEDSKHGNGDFGMDGDNDCEHQNRNKRLAGDDDAGSRHDGKTKYSKVRHHGNSTDIPEHTITDENSENIRNMLEFVSNDEQDPNVSRSLLSTPEFDTSESQSLLKPKKVTRMNINKQLNSSDVDKERISPSCIKTTVDKALPKKMSSNSVTVIEEITIYDSSDDDDDEVTFKGPAEKNLKIKKPTQSDDGGDIIASGNVIISSCSGKEADIESLSEDDRNVITATKRKQKRANPTEGAPQAKRTRTSYYVDANDSAPSGSIIGSMLSSQDYDITSSADSESHIVSSEIPRNKRYLLRGNQNSQSPVKEHSKPLTRSKSDATNLPHTVSGETLTPSSSKSQSPLASKSQSSSGSQSQRPSLALLKKNNNSSTESSQLISEIKEIGKTSNPSKYKNMRKETVIQVGQFHPFKRFLRSGKSIDEKVTDSEDDFQMHPFQRILRSGKFIVEKKVKTPKLKAKTKSVARQDFVEEGNIPEYSAAISPTKDQDSSTSLSKDVKQQEIPTADIDEEPKSPESVIFIGEYSTQEEHEEMETEQDITQSSSNSSSGIIEPSPTPRTASSSQAVPLCSRDEVDSRIEPSFGLGEEGRVLPLSPRLVVRLQDVQSQSSPFKTNIGNTMPLIFTTDGERIYPLPSRGRGNITPLSSDKHGGKSSAHSPAKVQKKALSKSGQATRGSPKPCSSKHSGYYLAGCTMPGLAERYCLSDSDSSFQQFSQDYCESRQDWLRAKAKMQTRDYTGRFLKTDSCPVRKRSRYAESKLKGKPSLSRRGLWCKKMYLPEDLSSDDEMDFGDEPKTAKVQIVSPAKSDEGVRESTSRALFSDDVFSQCQETSVQAESKPPSPNLASTAENSGEHFAAEPSSPGQSLSSPFRTPPESPAGFRTLSESPASHKRISFDSVSPKHSSNSPRSSQSRGGITKSPLSPTSPRCAGLMFDFYKKKAAVSGSDVEILWENRPNKQYHSNESVCGGVQQLLSENSNTPKEQQHQDPTLLPCTPKASKSQSPALGGSKPPHKPVTPQTNISKPIYPSRTPDKKVSPPVSAPSVRPTNTRTKDTAISAAVDLCGSKEMQKVHFLNRLGLCKMSERAKQSVEMIKKKNSQKRPLRATTEKKRTSWSYLNLKLVPNLVVTKLPEKAVDGKTPIKNGDGIVFAHPRQNTTSRNNKRQGSGKAAPVVPKKSKQSHVKQSHVVSTKRVHAPSRKSFTESSDSFRYNELLSHTSSSSELLSSSLNSPSFIGSNISAILGSTLVNTTCRPVQINLGPLVHSSPGKVNVTSILPSGQQTSVSYPVSLGKVQASMIKTPGLPSKIHDVSASIHRQLSPVKAKSARMAAPGQEKSVGTFIHPVSPGGVDTATISFGLDGRTHDLGRPIYPASPGILVSTGSNNKTQLPVDKHHLVPPSPSPSPEKRQYARARSCPLSCCNETPEKGYSTFKSRSPELQSENPPIVLSNLSVNCDNDYSFVVPNSMRSQLSPTLSFNMCSQHNTTPLKRPGSRRLSTIPTMQEHLQNTVTRPCLVKLDKLNIRDAKKSTRLEDTAPPVTL